MPGNTSDLNMPCRHNMQGYTQRCSFLSWIIIGGKTYQTQLCHDTALRTSNPSPLTRTHTEEICTRPRTQARQQTETRLHTHTHAIEHARAWPDADARVCKQSQCHTISHMQKHKPISTSPTYARRYACEHNVQQHLPLNLHKHTHAPSKKRPHEAVRLRKQIHKCDH